MLMAKKCCSYAKSTFFSHPAVTRPGTCSAVSIPRIDQVTKMENLSPPHDRISADSKSTLQTPRSSFSTSVCCLSDLSRYTSRLINQPLRCSQLIVQVSGKLRAKEAWRAYTAYGSRQIKDQAEIEESTSTGI